jgi:hypothetical protein
VSVPALNPNPGVRRGFGDRPPKAAIISPPPPDRVPALGHGTPPQDTHVTKPRLLALVPAMAPASRLLALVPAMAPASRLLCLVLALLPLAIASKNGANEPYTASSNKMFLHLLDLDTYPLAVCNDGSPGGFFFTPATSPQKNHLWVLFLEGGQWCYDAPSCYQRAQAQPFLISSQRWPPHQRFSGIFAKNPRRNPWAGANLVYLSYCSSDAWVGDAGPESNPMGWSESLTPACLSLLLGTASSLTLSRGLAPPSLQASEGSASLKPR